jgi:hypothetical protein
MHFEVLSEDSSGKVTLEILLDNLIPEGHSFKVISYKGIGRIPRDLSGKPDPQKRIFLSQIPSLLRGYGATYNGYPDDYKACVILVCDLDSKDLNDFLAELQTVLDSCNPKPLAKFCIAVEEGEAWFLGDLDAIVEAYPAAKMGPLEAYINDSICGTWEVLADAVYPGGSARLKSLGWQHTGLEKSNWAKKITPKMNLQNNDSPSFNHFRKTVMELLAE